MGRKNKLQKFAELLAFPNVYEHFSVEQADLVGRDGARVDLRGRWASGHFGNACPIILELACGRGEYTLGLARRYSGRNVIGVDIKGARLWKGARTALEEDLPNAAFLRCRIEWLDRFFAAGEVEAIWITFPDPFLRRSKANRRLTAPRFLDIYRKIMKPGGTVHLKTDSPELYAFTLGTIAAHEGATLLTAVEDIYRGALPVPELEIKTRYERMHLSEGKTIKYVSCRLA